MHAKVSKIEILTVQEEMASNRDNLMIKIVKEEMPSISVRLQPRSLKWLRA